MIEAKRPKMREIFSIFFNIRGFLSKSIKSDMNGITAPNQNPRTLNAPYVLALVHIRDNDKYIANKTTYKTHLFFKVLQIDVLAYTNVDKPHSVTTPIVRNPLKIPFPKYINRNIPFKYKANHIEGKALRIFMWVTPYN
jgi:hypothetical protein